MRNQWLAERSDFLKFASLRGIFRDEKSTWTFERGREKVWFVDHDEPTGMNGSVQRTMFGGNMYNKNRDR